MVMEAQPSPQNVGREFVRQYYTLLNKAPDHLHRFYNNSSSFLHEGLDSNSRDAPQLVVGQKQIHNRILQLNFRDCHAKISQVDAQGTLGNGVVVQVTGELSNAGQPMRRFTQTFVLGAQTPKKFYVHNDIFRYQDYYTEDEVEENGRSDTEEVDTDANEASVTPAIPQQQPIYYSATTTTNLYQSPQQPPPPTMNGLHSGVIEEVALQQPELVDTEAELIVDGGLSKDEEPSGYEDERQDAPQVFSNEPKTYANLVKLGGGAGAAPPAPSYVPAQASPPPAKFENNRFDPPLGASGNSNGGLNRDAITANSTTQKPLAQRPMRERRTSNSNVPSSSNPQQQFADSHQLFLGNIPHHASEEELRGLFGRFGTIADLRILSKQGQKIPGQRPPPNYGFITYDDAASVQECLANLPLYFPDNSPDGQKLNVEEKKTRTRAPGESGGRIGGGNNFSGGGMSNSLGGGQRQMSGGLQQNRNGPGNGLGPRNGGNQQRQPFNPNRGGSFTRTDRNNDRVGGGNGTGTNTFINNRR